MDKRHKNIKDLFRRGLVVMMAVSVILPLGTSPAAAFTTDDFKCAYFTTCFYNPNQCATPTDATQGNGNSGKATIVIDPGHSGTDNSVVDPQTGLLDHDYPNVPEISEVFSVAQKVQNKLHDDGYNVIMTKRSVNDTVSLRQRADIANNANADLAISIHDSHDTSWDNMSGGDGGQVYIQKVGFYRQNLPGMGRGTNKVTFTDDAVAQKSQRYGQIFAEQRTQTEGHKVEVVTESFNGRAGLPAGNIPEVQLFSKVPWVYNEVGAPSGPLPQSDINKYAQGLVAGVEKSVPLNNQTGTVSQAAGSAPSSLVMQTVDLSNFHPDPQAAHYFNRTSLPLLKKYIPLYVQAAQAEGVPQNWELLAGLHGPETGYGDYFQGNFLGWYAGPFQEDTRQLAAYLSDPTYGPVLKQLVTSDGHAINHSHLTDEQFVVLARLAFHHWIKDALGGYYNKLKTGPIPFDPAVDSGNKMWQIMNGWNPGAVASEGFNGYNTGANAYTGSPVWPGMATTYYLLKQWEANGGMNSISLGSQTSDCSNATANNGSPNCQAAIGNGRILCEAEQYKGIYYLWGGGHQSYSSFRRGCPESSLPGGPTTSTASSPGPCGTDCSGLVSVAVDAVFNQNYSWVVDDSSGMMTGSGSNVWKQVPFNQLQAGDIVTKPNPGHVEIVDHYNASSQMVYTFGSHFPGAKTSPSSAPKSYYMYAWRYVGPGSGS